MREFTVGELFIYKLRIILTDRDGRRPAFALQRKKQFERKVAFGKHLNELRRAP